MKSSAHLTRPVRLFGLWLVMILLEACSAVQPVRVLQKGEGAMTASLGGAVVPNSSPTGLVPYLTAGYAYGISSDITVHGKSHLIMAAFGVAGLDVGGSMRVLAEHDALPEVTLGAQIIGFAGISRPAPMRVYPNLTANASWAIGSSSLLYVGSHATIEIDPSTLFVSPFAGYQFHVSDGLRLQVETIWQASNINTQKGVFEGQSSIGGTGSFGIYIGGMIAL